MPHTVHVLYKKNVTFYWLKLDHWSWRKLSVYFCSYYLPLQMDIPVYLNKLESLHLFG
jgi:hypothetical protein